MIHFYAIALLVLCGQVELFKLGLLATPQSDQAEYYPARQQSYGYQYQQTYAGRPQQLPYQTNQPPPLAYVIVRPIAPSYPYYDSSFRYWAPLQQAPPAFDSGVKGLQEQQQQLPALEQQAAPTKGGSLRADYIKQEKLEHEPALHQQQEPILHQQPQPEPANQPDQLHDSGMAKLLKIKSHIDRFAASAKSKLTLGSNYYVAGEEIVPPPVQAQPLRQEQVQTSDLQLTKLEQQRIEDASQTKLDSQQQLEDIRQTKLEESRGTKLEEPRQIKLEEAPPVTQTKLEDTRQEKLAEQEPLREKETKGLEQPLQQQQPQQERYNAKGLQQQRYADKGLQHQQQARDEYQQVPLKSEQRDQLRFNGQQPTAYLANQAESDGFGKRNSAI